MRLFFFIKILFNWMQKESIFIEGQIDTTTLPMLITTNNTSEVLAGPFFSLPQSKQQNETVSGGNEWFCWSEKDLWNISYVESSPHMTHLWASTTGTDTWEMADHHDPFSVYDSKTALLEFQPTLENDSSLTSSAHGHSTVSTTFSATEFPNGLLSDSTDSDSCSDYIVHSSVTMMTILIGKMSGKIVVLPDFNLLIQWPRCWTQPCIVEHYQESTYSTSSSLAPWNMFCMTIHGERNTSGTQHCQLCDMRLLVTF